MLNAGQWLYRFTARPLASRMSWLLLLWLAAGLRLLAPNWDSGIAAHPDERYLLGVAMDVPLGTNICVREPDFAYGHLPVLLAQLLVRSAPEQDPLYTARLMSALIGVVGVVLAGGLGQELGGRWGGVLAIALATFSPFLIQQAHFYTVDPLGMVFASGAALAAVRRRWSPAGALAGLAVACKLTLAIAVVPLLTAALLSREQRSQCGGEHPKRGGTGAPGRLVLSSLGAFLLVSPWSLVTPVQCWRGPLIQGLMVSGQYELPYTLQYAGTVPYAYPLAQMALWGLGLPATALGAWGLVLRARRRHGLRSVLASPAWIWPVAYFLAVGGLSVKFARYMLPVYPIWVAWAAYAVVSAGRIRTCSRVVLGGLVVSATGIIGLAQVGVYTQPHPWVVASQRIYDLTEPGAVVSNEEWDHPLPVPLPGQDGAALMQVIAPIYDEDTRAKLQQLGDLSTRADVVVISSRRGYGALARWPDRYGATLAWYADILSERRVEAFTRCPHIGPVAISDDPLSDAHLNAGPTLAELCGTRWAVRLPRLDESYRVYDAPLTLILWPRR